MSRRGAYEYPLPGGAFEPIASEHRGMIDAALAHRDSRTGADLAAPPALAPYPRMQNVTGEDVAYGHALGIGNPVFTADSGNDPGEFGRQLLLEGDTPASPEHHGYFGVVMEPVRAGEVARVTLSGFVLAKVNVIDAGDAFADIDDGETLLKSNPNGGAMILAKGSETGEVWAWLSLDGMLKRARTYWAKITSSSTNTNNQTEYQVAEVYPRTGSNLGAFAEVAGGRTGSAYAVSESANTNTLAGGVDLTADAYPDGFDPLVIPDDEIVLIREALQGNGNVLRVFTHGHTAHFGDCS
ncbi:MAG: hypothetical protein AAGH64_05630 [Planctomycetota bacterium]